MCTLADWVFLFDALPGNIMNVRITHRDVDVYIIYLLSISPVSLSSRRSVLSSDEASTQLPSREKLTHVTGSGRLRVKTE